jgi:hypothetical protein
MCINIDWFDVGLAENDVTAEQRKQTAKFKAATDD